MPQNNPPKVLNFSFSHIIQTVFGIYAIIRSHHVVLPAASIHLLTFLGLPPASIANLD